MCECVREKERHPFIVRRKGQKRQGIVLSPLTFPPNHAVGKTGAGDLKGGCDGGVGSCAKTAVVAKRVEQSIIRGELNVRKRVNKYINPIQIPHSKPICLTKFGYCKERRTNYVRRTHEPLGTEYLKI